MENIVDGSKFYVGMDQRINVTDAMPVWVSQKGSSSIAYVQEEINGSIGPTSLLFNHVPGVNNIVDKKMHLDLEVNFTIRSNDGAGNLTVQQMFPGPLLIGGRRYIDTGVDSIKCYPFLQCCKSIQFTINGKPITVSVRDYIEPLTRAGFWEQYVNHELSTTGAMHDTFELYDANSGGDAALAGPSSQNTRYMPRGHIPIEIVNWVANPNTGAELKIRLSEPLLLPLLGSVHDELGFCNVDNLSVKINYDHLHRMLASGSDALGANVGAPHTVTIVSSSLSSARLRLRDLRPPENVAVPSVVHYPYYELNQWASPQQAMAEVALFEGAETQFSVNNITLGGVPSRIFLWVDKGQQWKDSAVQSTYGVYPWNEPDTYAEISRIEVRYNNSLVAFTSATSYDLYETSLKAGNIDMTYPQWLWQVGSVMCISPEYLPLTSGLASGVLGTATLQIKVWARNHRLQTDGDLHQLNVVVLEEGIFELYPGRAETRMNPVSALNVLEGEYLKHADYVDPNGLRGGIFGFLRKAGNAVGRAVQWAAKNAPRAISAVKKGIAVAERYAPTAMRIAEGVAPVLLGLGMNQGDVDEFVQSGMAGSGLGVSGRGFGGEASSSGMAGQGLMAARGGRSASLKKKK